MKVKAKLLLCLVLTVLLLASSLPVAQAQTFYFNTANTGGQSYQVELYYGKYDKQVETVKQKLKDLGYYQGFITPWFSPELELAVKEFQRDFGLAITGRVDSQTFAALFHGTANEASEQPQAPEKTVPQPDQGWNSGSTTSYLQGNYKVEVQRVGNRLIIHYRLVGEEPAPAPAPVQGLTALEQQMVDLVNQERLANGLQPLKVDLDLVRTARMKSQDLVDNNYFDHQSPTYGSPFDLMRSQGITYRYAGENLAGAPSVERAHTALMNSPGHRANILNPNYTHIGIGIIQGGPYGMMFTQHFVGR